MNDLNPWEKQLASWTPRPPSAKLKQRLFAAAPAVAPARDLPVQTAWLWLAPATALLLLTFCFGMARSEHPGAPGLTGGSNLLASLSLPGQPTMPYFALDTRAQGWNIWSAVTFGLDKGGRSLSTTGSFPLWKTNIQKL